MRKENLKALEKGVDNLEKHLENLLSFGPPVVVAINRFPDDTDAEVALLTERVAALGAKVVLSDVWAKGGEGGLELAEEVVRLCEVKEKPVLKYAYELGMSIAEKIESIATKIYGADGVDYHYEANAAIERFTRLGYGTLPVCMAKTQSSLSDDKTKLGRPRGWRLTVREIRLSAGAGMVIPVCGSIMTMPGLPKRPAAREHRPDQRRDSGVVVVSGRGGAQLGRRSPRAAGRPPARGRAGQRRRPTPDWYHPSRTWTGWPATRPSRAVAAWPRWWARWEPLS